jgi:hypothetical protein
MRPALPQGTGRGLRPPGSVVSVASHPVDDANATTSDPVTRLLDVLQSRHAFLTTRGMNSPRQLAAGGLMRAESLLRGLRRALHDGSDDLAGLFIRSIMECWWVGLYLIFFEDEAVDHLRAYFRRRYNLYRETIPPEVTLSPDPVDLWDGWPDPRSDFKIEDIANLVEARLRDEEHGPITHAGISSYRVLYTLESAASIHAGWGSFTRYLTVSEDGEREEVVPNPRSDALLDKGEYVGAGYTAILAWYVHDRFSISTVEIGALIPEILSRAGMLQ